MNLFAENVKYYLNTYKIKQSFLAAKSGLSPAKISRILTGKRDITFKEMSAVSNALGKDISFFLQEKLVLSSPFETEDTGKIVYVGTFTEEQKEAAEELVSLVDTINFINASYRDFFGNKMVPAQTEENARPGGCSKAAENQPE